MVEYGFDLTPGLDSFNGYNELKILVNNIEIRHREMLDFQIDYGKEERGYISFVDSLGIVELAPLSFGVIEVYFIDKLKAEQTKRYIITKVETIRAKNNSINIDLEFEEEDTYKLKTAFISKSFKDFSILEIIESLLNDLKIKAEINNKDKIKKYEFFVTPGNISVYDFILKQSKIDDFNFFVDRMGYVFSDRDSFDFSKSKSLKESDFSFTNKMPYWRILEYKGKISNIEEIRNCVNSDLTNPNIEDLKYDSKDLKILDIYETQKLNDYSGIADSTIPDIFSNFGKKQINHIYKTSILGDNIDFREYMKSTQSISIAVQGVLSVRMYGSINIKIPRASITKNSKNDSIFSGKFIVTKVVDKIMGDKYFQILELKSSDYGKPENQK